ncbi:MAG: hypothetical protein RIF32_22660 [Leptospirales bacterium]|jgi:hypothetical protein
MKRSFFVAIATLLLTSLSCASGDAADESAGKVAPIPDQGWVALTRCTMTAASSELYYLKTFRSATMIESCQLNPSGGKQSPNRTGSIAAEGDQGQYKITWLQPQRFTQPGSYPWASLSGRQVLMIGEGNNQICYIKTAAVKAECGFSK